MARFDRPRHLAPALLLIVVGVALLPTAARVVFSSQWSLDVEQAMDAIGLTPGMVVGEAGAGDGYFTFPMARRVGPEGLVFANDISQRALRSLERRRNREGLENIQTVVGEVDDPLFPRRDLQMVVLVHAFHDFSRPVEWLANAKTYLRSGGTVAVIDKDPAQGAESHFWSRERIVRCAAEAGYELVSAVEAVSEHLILVFRPAPSHSRPPGGRLRQPPDSPPRLAFAEVRPLPRCTSAPPRPQTGSVIVFRWCCDAAASGSRACALPHRLGPLVL